MHLVSFHADKRDSSYKGKKKFYSSFPLNESFWFFFSFSFMLTILDEKTKEGTRQVLIQCFIQNFSHFSHQNNHLLDMVDIKDSKQL